MGFPRQEYWSGLPFPPSEDLPHPGTEPASLRSPALARGFLALVPPGVEYSVQFSCSVVSDFVTPWTAACLGLLSMGFTRQEYWSGLPFPPPGDLPEPGIQPASSTLAGGFFSIEPWINLFLFLLSNGKSRIVVVLEER